MFSNYSHKEKTAIFVIATANIPTEVCVKELDDWSQLWCQHALQKLTDELELPKSNIDAYMPLLISDTPYCEMGWDRRQDYVVPYLALLQDQKMEWKYLYTMYLIFLFEAGLIDGRGHTLLRNIAQSLHLDSEDVMWINNLLIKFMVNQQASIDQAKLSKRDRSRYLKIGAVALGAGALIAFTGGLAAPAVAGALVLLGTSTATAATVAGSMMLMFGGTGAGLAGYKMAKRTRGLTDFEFTQYDEKGRMAVMIMVSGWMEEDEDDKRTFGVVPSEENISLKERLVRYYRIHDPSRLSYAELEAANYSRDPSPLFSALKERYGKDPLDAESLIPPLPLPDAERAAEALELITKCFQAIAEEVARQKDSAEKEKSKTRSLFSFGGDSKRSGGAEGAGTAGASTGQRAFIYDNDEEEDDGEEGKEENNIEESVSEDAVYDDNAAESKQDATQDIHQAQSKLDALSNVNLDSSVKADTTEPEKVVEEEEVSTARLAEWDQQRDAIATIDGSVSVPHMMRSTSRADSVRAVHLADDFKYWHWRELSISPAYELNLLRWETQMQKDLGNSILNLLKGLGTSAAKTALKYTAAGALLAAVALPLTLISLLDSIDNLWQIAVERADLAGKELARALLERPHGQRPVTLVGYSMGCRVIFSCLKELAKQLDLPANSVAKDSGDKHTEEGEKIEDKGENEEMRGAQSMPSHEESSRKESPVGDEEQSVKASAPPVQRASTAGSMLYSGASSLGRGASSLGRGVYSLGGKIATPVANSVSSVSNAVTGAKSEGSKGKNGGEESPQLLPRELKGLIGDVVLLGAPLDPKDAGWERIRALVGGRLVNGYSKNDLVLSVMYRYQQWKIGVSGVSPVPAAGVENIDLTHIVTKHSHYNLKMKEILEEVNLSSSLPHPSSYTNNDPSAFGMSSKATSDDDTTRL
eukprot:gene10592-12368_t